MFLPVASVSANNRSQRRREEEAGGGASKTQGQGSFTVVLVLAQLWFGRSHVTFGEQTQ